MPYVPPYKRSQNSFAALSDEPVAAPVKASTYVPPSKREVDPLAPENFPALGATVARNTVKQNFLERIQAAEEARQRAAEAELYDPEKFETLTTQQLEKEGWGVLSLSAARQKSYAADFHRRLDLIETPEVKPVVVPPQPQDFEDDYSDYEEEIESPEEF